MFAAKKVWLRKRKMFDLNVDLVDLVSTSRCIGGSGLDGGFLSLFGPDEIDALANVDQVAAAEADHQNVVADVVADTAGSAWWTNCS